MTCQLSAVGGSLGCESIVAVRLAHQSWGLLATYPPTATGRLLTHAACSGGKATARIRLPWMRTTLARQAACAKSVPEALARPASGQIHMTDGRNDLSTKIVECLQRIAHLRQGFRPLGPSGCDERLSDATS